MDRLHVPVDHDPSRLEECVPRQYPSEEEKAKDFSF